MLSFVLPSAETKSFLSSCGGGDFCIPVCPFFYCSIRIFRYAYTTKRRITVTSMDAKYLASPKTRNLFYKIFV